MSPEQYAEMVGYLETHWGTLHKGFIGRETYLYPDFRVYPAAMANETVRDLFYDGSNTCPSPSKVIARLRARMSVTGNVSGATQAPCVDGNHTWAFTETAAGEREAMCAVCRVEKTFNEEDLQTTSELLDGPSKPPPEDVY